MSRNEETTRRELIEPALHAKGWAFDRELKIGPGRVNLSGEHMYDASQEIRADYLLRLWSMPLAVLEAKAEGSAAADGIQQGQRYAQRLGLRFSIASNGHDYILTDDVTGEFATFTDLPSPGDVLHFGGLNAIPEDWRATFDTPWYVDQVSKKHVRPYQEAAVYKALYAMSQERRRAMLLMATGTGKTFTMFQLVWKLLHGDVLAQGRVLFLTDRNSLKRQAYKAFAGFSVHDRVQVDAELVATKNHEVGKIFFANYQNLDEELDGKKLYQHFPADFFDLVIIDECHRSGFGDWFGTLEYFQSAFQLGLTATPRELDKAGRPLLDNELRRDTYEYFGDPIYTYSLKQAIEDGYLVPYLLEQRITNVDELGFTGPDGRQYTTANFERDVRMPDRTKAIAEDLWAVLGRYGTREEKTIIFCVDDTHAAFMAQELRRVSGDNQYAARITRSERNSHQLEKNFAEVGNTKSRVAVTVDLLTTGFDAPDVRNIVFCRPLKSAILYKQMKGRGTRLCEGIDKRYFSIFDYSAASLLEDAEFDGHPANIQKPAVKSKPAQGGAATGGQPRVLPIGAGVVISISATHRFACLADGQKIPFEDYCAQGRELVRSLIGGSPAELLDIWVDRRAREAARAALGEHDIHIPAFRVFMDLTDADDVDILTKVAFDPPRVPARRDRVDRLWQAEEPWLLDLVDERAVDPAEQWKRTFWETALDH